MLSSILWMIFTCVEILSGQKLMNIENAQSTEIVQLGGNLWPSRQKRSTDFGFPQTIPLKFTINGNEKVDLELKRRYLPFIPSINGNSKTDSLQHHATYQNPTEGAAITVRCRDRNTRPCQMYGTFSHESQVYQIQALSYGEDYLHEIVRLDLENRSFLGLQKEAHVKTKNRRKRYAGGTNIQTKYVAEMLLWIDFLIYARFLETAGDDAVEAELNIQTFAIGVMNEVDTRARNLQIQALEMGISNAADLDLSVMLTELVVCKTADFCVWSENPSYNNNGVLQTNALLAFIATLILYKKTNYDFAVGLTGYEVLDERHSDTNCGVYFLDNQMCVAENLTYVSSIAKATEGGVGFNVAHFLGRHIGMIGDVTETSCAEDNYLSSSDWSPGTSDKASHPFHWSNCTIERIYTSAQTSGKNDCLLVNNFFNDTYLAYHSALEPGRELGADIQCKYEYGSTSTFCGTQDASICYTGISCTNPDTNVCEKVALPLDGTFCHELAQPLPKKMCEQGACVEIITTPTTTPTTTTTTTTTPSTTTTTPTTTTTTRSTTTTTPTTSTASPTTTTTTPTTTTTTPTTTTITPTTTTTTPTTTTTKPTTTTTTPITTTTTPTTTTTTRSTTTTTPTTSTATPTTTTTTLTTTTTTPTTTTTTPTTTTTTPTTTTTTPKTTTTTPTTTTTTPTTTTTTPTTTTSTPTTTTTIPTTTTTTPTTTTTTTRSTTTTSPTTTTTTPTTTTTTPTIRTTTLPRSTTIQPTSSTTKSSTPKTRTTTVQPKPTTTTQIPTGSTKPSQSSTTAFTIPYPTTLMTIPYSPVTLIPPNMPFLMSRISSSLSSTEAGSYTTTEIRY